MSLKHLLGSCRGTSEECRRNPELANGALTRRHSKQDKGRRWMVILIVIWLVGVVGSANAAAPDDRFEGQYFSGRGDVEYVRLLDISRRMFAPDPELENVSMLYMPAWDGLVEGPTWDAWWIQNSYGTTYAALPFYTEPFVTFLQNSQDLWFDQMGDGKRVGAAPPFNWVAPDGCLCDAARPGWIVYKQGDGRTAIHDWGMEFTAAGLLLQSELLLISRDARAIDKYLPKLERCAAFIETRRDATNNLFLAGPAGNLLAPSYAGWKKPDGTYGMAYLAGLSVTYIGALDRLIELEKLAGRTGKAAEFQEARASAKAGLTQLTTDEGYFIRSLDPDGTRHGVFGAPQHEYFEASPNHDAICFRVADDAQSRKIYAKIQAIPELRPHRFVLPNYPSYDDMYEKPEGLWTFGTWVNGGHWSTCEARMIMAYYRLGAFEDARRSLQQLLPFARAFRMDNPLVKFGSAVYQPNQPVNLTYDAFGPPAAFVRGLFEYLYTAAGLKLIPHIPPEITQLEQHFPIRFGNKRLFVSSVGHGEITGVLLNGREWTQHDAHSISLPYAELPNRIHVQVLLGGAGAVEHSFRELPGSDLPEMERGGSPGGLGREPRLRLWHDRLVSAGLGDSYEAAHLRLAVQTASVAAERRTLLAEKKLEALPESTAAAADKLYAQTTTRITDGFEALLSSYEKSQDAHQRRVFSLLGSATDKSSAAPANDATASYSLSNATVTVTVRLGDGTFEVVDRRTGRTWSQTPAEPDWKTVATEPGQTGVRLTLRHSGSGREVGVELHLDENRPELLVQLEGEGELATSLGLPRPFVSQAGESLIIPMNEGISYPVDDASIKPMHLIAYGGHGICMSFWGATDGDAGYMGLLETPDDAAIQLLRVEGRLTVAPHWESQKGQFGYPRRVRYVFFDKGGYVAMCKRYRAHAQETGIFKTLAEKKAANPNVDRLVGAANVWCWDKDALAIVREMKAVGMERILWSNRQAPDAVRAMNDLGVLTSRYDIYQDLMDPANFPQLHGVHPDWTTDGFPKDIMIGRDGNWIRGWEVDGKDHRRYACAVLCDRVAPDYARRRIPAELAGNPYLCRFIDTTTASPWRECYAPEHPLTRSDSRRWKMELLRYVKDDAHLVTGSETGHDAAVPFVDYFEGMLSLGPYRVPDSGRDMQRIWTEVPEEVAKFQLGQRYRLPLWELVFHDCVVAQWYWGDYNNKLPALWDKRDLFNALYGTPPMFMFTHALWTANRERFRQSYDATSPVARATGYSEMADHRYLTPDRDVQQTRFANGVSVTVNFGQEPYRLIDGSLLGPGRSLVTGLAKATEN